ncbi:DNA internalization-related competence protein ComEC/Rec2 [Endozoicomonas arenosclerae]|uniref:DNA internalization-related competence protein ComEC/Rec2 n=1 Tax=Endozoicomonas arenosclerae TaxID=1633495 RepID=UPI0007866C9C|nr:DNA internalization-related competence protein ComEC/Rec2 [Endozoicomonas arenosclerae]
MLLPAVPGEMSIRVIGVLGVLLIMTGLLTGIIKAVARQVTVSGALKRGGVCRRLCNVSTGSKGTVSYLCGSSALSVFYPGVFLLGIFTGFLHAEALQESWISKEVEGKTLRVEGYVSDLPAYYQNLTRFDFNVRTLQGESIANLGKVRLSWYQAPEIKAGDHWQLEIRLKHPQGNRSPGAFDREAWAARENIQAVGYVRGGEKIADAEGFHYLRSQIRSSVRQWLYESCSENSAALLSALLIGDKSGISQQQWQWLNQSGTTHLMVISGLHIGLMAAVGYWWVMMLARLGALPLRKIVLPRYAACVAILFALAYAFMAGFTVPVQRALVMTGLALSGPLLGIKARPLTLFLLALSIVLTIEPLAVTSAGFWYSFSAVGILLYGCCGRVDLSESSSEIKQQIARPRSWLKPQWLVFVMLAPMLLFNQQSVSLLSPLINLVAIPVMGVLIVPSAFLALLLQPFPGGLSAGILQALDQFFRLWDQQLSWVSSIPLYIPAVNIGFEQLVLLGAAVLILVAPAALGLRIVALFLVLPFLFPRITNPKHGEANVAVLDVGQGVSVLVQTQHNSLLYDTGLPSRGRFSTAENIILPYLNYSRISKLDRIIVSHGDSDHSGGLERLQRHFPDTEVLAGSSVEDFEGHLSPCLSGMRWQWDGVDFEVLSGSQPMSSDNERSCVIRVRAGSQVMLLTGDIGKKTESSLLSSNKSLRADFLMLPHHGSRFSGSAGFLSQVDPSHVLVSAGYRNPFGHPARETVERVSELGATLYETASSGTVSFVIGQEQREVKRYRYEKSRYWWR